MPLDERANVGVGLCGLRSEADYLGDDWREIRAPRATVPASTQEAECAGDDKYSCKALPHRSLPASRVARATGDQRLSITRRRPVTNAAGSWRGPSASTTRRGESRRSPRRRTPGESAAGTSGPAGGGRGAAPKAAARWPAVVCAGFSPSLSRDLLPWASFTAAPPHPAAARPPSPTEGRRAHSHSPSLTQQPPTRNPLVSAASAPPWSIRSGCCGSSCSRWGRPPAAACARSGRWCRSCRP